MRHTLLILAFIYCGTATGQLPEYELITNAGPFLGGAGNGRSDDARATKDGRFIVFESGASNFVPGDTNGAADIFLFDRQCTCIERVSLNSQGQQLDQGSLSADISDDGRYVVFENYTSTRPTVMLKDRQSGELRVVSQTPMGMPASGSTPRISGDGQTIVFLTDDDAILGEFGSTQVVSFVPATGTTELISKAPDGSLANGFSGHVSVSDDGQRIAFHSWADNLAIDVNNRGDVFLMDRSTGMVTLQSLSSQGIQGNSDSTLPDISGDGTTIAFLSDARTLWPGLPISFTNTQAYVRVIDAATTELVSRTATDDWADFVRDVSVSDDGTQVGFFVFSLDIADTSYDGYLVRDQGTQSFTTLGMLSNVQLVGDGASVIFESADPLLIEDRNEKDDLYLLQITPANSEPELISWAGPGSMLDSGSQQSVEQHALSGDGLTIAFSSRASDLVPVDSFLQQVYGVDRGIEGIALISANSSGEVADDWAEVHAVSEQGDLVLIETAATNLAEDNPPGRPNRLLLADRTLDQFEVVVDEIQFDSSGIAMSPDARFVAFSSRRSDLVPIDVNNSEDVFLLDRQLDELSMVSVSSTGIQGNADSIAPAVSSDARFITFQSASRTLSDVPTDDITNVFLHDSALGTTSQLSVAFDGSAPNNRSEQPSISHDGSRVVFLSSATNFVQDVPFHSFRNVYLFDATMSPPLRKLSVRARLNSVDCSSAKISADGRWAIFTCNGTVSDSEAITDPFDYYAFRMRIDGGEPEPVAVNEEGVAVVSTAVDISTDGQQVIFVSEGNGIIRGETSARQLILADYGIATLVRDGFEQR